MGRGRGYQPRSRDSVDERSRTAMLSPIAEVSRNQGLGIGEE